MEGSRQDYVIQLAASLATRSIAPQENSMPRTLAAILLLFWLSAPALAQAVDSTQSDLASQIRALNPQVLPASSDSASQPANMLSRDIRRRLFEANHRESAAWHEIKSAGDWQRYAQPRIHALKEKLGIQDTPGTPPEHLVTGRIEGDGYEISNVVFESRPGLAVTANLYRPREPKQQQKMPAILVVHSHHAPKTQGELQDMGITWARQGAVVLMMDMPGHGERRQHKFVDEASYPRSFRVSRQDYYFRYNLGLQLPLIGQSLMAWMVYDLRRGIDLVTSLPGVDKNRIALLGAVAGGGDPCAVTAAVDKRISVACPFNFGGPQPETVLSAAGGRRNGLSLCRRRKLGIDAQLAVLRCRGFSPLGDRRLCRAARTDLRSRVCLGPAARPGLEAAGDHFRFLRCPRSPELRARPRPAQWAAPRIDPLHKYRSRASRSDSPGAAGLVQHPCAREGGQRAPPAAELHAMTPEATQQFQPKPVHELVAGTVGRGDRPTNRQTFREQWGRVLGEIEPFDPRELRRETDGGSMRVERIALEIEPGIQVPLLLLRPNKAEQARPPVVLGLAQTGKKGFLEHRSESIARLLAGGAAVCLPDLRGMGETRPGDGRGRQSSATSLSASAWMLGQTMLGWRLKDLRSVCRWLQKRDDLDATHLVLWGESFAPVNDPHREFAVPWDADDLPQQSEPGGALLALLGGLFEDHVRGVYGRGGLVSYRSLLNSPYLYVPHDAIVPFALSNDRTDLDDVAAAHVSALVAMGGARRRPESRRRSGG